MNKETKPCMLHLSVHADQTIDRMRIEEPYSTSHRRTPSRSEFVEDAIMHYAKHLEAQLDGQRA